MRDEILEQEFYENAIDTGLDAYSAKIATIEAREDGLFDVPEDY